MRSIRLLVVALAKISCRLIAGVCPKSAFLAPARIRSYIFTYIIQKKLKSVDGYFYVEYPAQITGEHHISLGRNFTAGRNLRLEAIEKHLGVGFQPVLSIGKNVSINDDCHIACINNIVIEDDVLIASKVFITDHLHGRVDHDAKLTPPRRRAAWSKGSVKIGRATWIGEGVSILPGVHIGNNCVIGAGSVVTKSFDKNLVIAGNPAKVIKHL